MSRESIVGKTFTRLLVLEKTTERRHNHPLYRCLCECGTEVKTFSSCLTRGATKSCGCLRRERFMAGKRHWKHGGYDLPEYKVWATMLARCRNPNTPCYKNYGGRGIYVVERWNDFTKFFQDMGPRPDHSYSINRIDNDGPYSPENCVWSTREEQARSKRGTDLIEWNDETKTLRQWALTYQIKYATLWYRINKCHLPFDIALTTPLQQGTTHHV